MVAYHIKADENYWAVIPKELDIEVYCQTCHTPTKKPIVLLKDFTIIADSCSQKCLKEYIKREYRIIDSQPRNSI